MIYAGMLIFYSYRVTITPYISAGYFKRDFFCSTADMYELVNNIVYEDGMWDLG